jgi:hypothetical protein
MNEGPPLPLRHKMNPPFDDMGGKRILVSNSTGSAIKEITAYWRPEEGTFGITIPFPQPPVSDGIPSLGAPGELVIRNGGHFDVGYLRLSEDEIQSIKKVDHQDYRFTIELSSSRIRFS